MSIATDRFPDVSRLSRTSRILIEKSDHIERIWASKALATIPESRKLLKPILLNTFPTYIANLAEALSPDFPRQTAIEDCSVAESHGRERFNMTDYNLNQLITEYILMREVIIKELDEEDGLTKAELGVIERSIVLAIQAAVTSYAATQDEIRRTFIATLSHDVRNPICTIKMASDLLLDEPFADIEVKNLVSMISSNADKADDLLVAVLNSSLAANNAKIRLEITACCMNDIINSSINQFRLRAKGGIYFKGERVEGYWSKRDLERSLDNLISNAIKYGSKDTPIELEISEKHERVILSVHNSGRAIPKSEQDKIFLPFERSQSAQESEDEGWGLGLPFVQAVAEAHGGSLLVDSSPERGTTFTIDIPVDGRKFYG